MNETTTRAVKPWRARIRPAALLAITITVAPLVVAMAGVASCIAIAEGDGIPRKITDLDDATPDAIVIPDRPPGSLDGASELPPSDPHSVLGVMPSHGPFTGGRVVSIRGSGFSPQQRVWFGKVQVPESDVIVASPTRLQAIVPPGQAGPVDVHTQRGDDPSTHRTLQGAYTYDAFYADPLTGPTSGGTEIRVLGQHPHWTDAARVFVANEPCVDTKWVSPTELTCMTPAHAEGTVSISVQDSDAGVETVFDAFVYTDSDNGFRGGMSGSKLDGRMKVAAYNAYSGDPIPGADVIVASLISDMLTAKTNAAGLVELRDARLSGNATVTVAMRCFQPTTFVDVPVDTVTVYLSPVLTLDCMPDSGEIPPVGGRWSSSASIKGALVWPGFSGEFQRATWNNVPVPSSPDEQQVAYIFQPSWDATARFVLPDANRAVRPSGPGTMGYDFAVGSGVGNVTLYALAGIENRRVQPARFIAYAMGITQGIRTDANATTADVMIAMNKPLDQVVQLHVEPPRPGPRGPDRLYASVSVRLGNEGYMILPNGQRVVGLADGVDDTGAIAVVGLPGLTGPLFGASYVASARAVTGPGLGAPMSIIGRYLFPAAHVPVSMTGFVQVPVLQTPAIGDAFDGLRLQVTTAQGGAMVDVTVFRVQGMGGRYEWLIVAPGGKQTVLLPDLERLGHRVPKGPMSIHVYVGDVADDGFTYGNLAYRHTDSRGWAAYAYDVFHTYH